MGKKATTKIKSPPKSSKRPVKLAPAKHQTGYEITLRAIIIVVLALGMLVFVGTPKSEESKTQVIAEQNIPKVLKNPSILSAIAPKADVQNSPTQNPANLPLHPSSLRVPILYYHYIEINPNPVGDPGRDSLLITPDNFVDQMITLKLSGYTTITLDDLEAAIKYSKPLPPRPIVITVDDGYSDFYYNAFPVLKKLDIKATVFVLSRGAQMQPPGFYMSDDQIKELSQSPLITVACHTLDHTDLKDKPEDLQRDEIFTCRDQLEKLIGKPVRHFAYPYGDFDTTTLKLVQEAGFETASSTIGGATQSLENIYTLRRIHVGNYGGQELLTILEKIP